MSKLCDTRVGEEYRASQGPDSDSYQKINTGEVQSWNWE